MESFSLTDIKKKNLSDIYHYIYHAPRCSKQTIATALNISLPTVTQHLTTLLNENLVEKCGQLSSSVGRRATAYRIVSTARVAVGIEILEHKLYIVSLDLYGKKRIKEKHQLNFHDPDYFEKLKNLVLDFLSGHDYREEQILGIGLGIQGLASRDGRKITYGQVLNCTGLTIDGFSKYFQFPCRFFHDPECAANSELWQNPEIQDAIYLSLGYYLGGAIIINGKFQSGMTGKSGVFEHMTLFPGGIPCYCGKSGCASCYCSGFSLLDGQTELEDFFSKKMQEGSAYQEKWDAYLHYLAMLINNLHMVIESNIILGGHVASHFTGSDMQTIRQRVYELSTFQDDPSYIFLGRCRVDAVSIGAALPFIKEFLGSIALQEPE